MQTASAILCTRHQTPWLVPHPTQVQSAGPCQRVIYAKPTNVNTFTEALSILDFPNLELSLSFWFLLHFPWFKIQPWSVYSCVIFQADVNFANLGKLRIQLWLRMGGRPKHSTCRLDG